MVKNTNDVAILLATYNGEKYVRRQLDSLSEQSYSRFTCYIHDDGSNDGTRQIIDDYVKHDNRFVYVEGPSQHGAKGNFMYLLSNVESNYYLFCDQDDYWHKNKVERLLSSVKSVEENGKTPSLCFCNLNVVDETGEMISNDFMTYSGFYIKRLDYKNILFKNVAPGCVMILNKKLRDEAIKLTECANIEMHDWWCISIACIMGKCFFVNESLNDYYQHSSQQIGAVRDDSLINKITKKMVSVFSRNERMQKENWLVCVSSQANELCHVITSKSSVFSEIYTLAHLRDKCKILRVFYLFRYRWNYAGSLIWNILWI